MGLILPKKAAKGPHTLMVMGQLMPGRVVPRDCLWRESDDDALIYPVVGDPNSNGEVDPQEQFEHQLDPERVMVPFAKCVLAIALRALHW